jgi:hypothetical protein
MTMHARPSIAAFLWVLGLGACGDDTPATTSNPQIDNPAPGASGSGGNGASPGPGSGTGTSSLAGRSGSAGVSGAGASSGDLGGDGSGDAGNAGLAAGGGGNSAANGGSAGSAANGGSGGAAGASSGAYFVSGRLHGYAWTSAAGTDSTIAPADFTALGANDPRCVMGSVGASADYSGVAMLGVNLNQDQSTDAPIATITPTAGGLSVSLTNNAKSPLRLQIQAPDGATNADDRWCAPLTGDGGFVAWSSFNTACWDGSGTAYADQPISAAMLLVPGGNMTAQAFDFCLNRLSEADAPSGSAGAGGSSAAGSGGSGGSAADGGGAGTAGGGSLPAGNGTGTGTITDPYGVAMVTRDGKNYVIQNNVWGNDTSQSIGYDGTTYTITEQTGMNAASGPNAGAPVSYPSVFIGSNYNRMTAGSNLPKQVSALGTVKTGWSNNAGPAVSGIYNAAYDVWFSTNAAGDPEAPSGGYLMVWYYKPDGAQPIGNVMKMGITIAGVSGTWDVWQGPNNGKPVISYVRTESINSLEYDLNAFIKDATDNQNVIQKSWYLSNVFAGFEIWSGGVGLKTTSFYADVE